MRVQEAITEVLKAELIGQIRRNRTGVNVLSDLRSEGVDSGRAA